MAEIKLIVRTSETIVDELDSLINHGIFRNRTEAVNEGIKLLINRYRAERIAEKMDRIAAEKHGKVSLTKALFELRKEEDT